MHRRFPELKVITTHFGGWDIWDEVEEMLIGKEIFMEISFALTYLSSEQAVRMLNNHPANCLLFGSDSPWDDQSSALQRLKQLPLGHDLLSGILGTNAELLLQRHNRSTMIKSY